MTLIIHEFIHGPWDGRNLSNDSLDPVEIRQAVDLYMNTDQGREGKRFFLAGYEYIITNRTEVGNEVLIRFECLPEPPSAAASTCRGQLRADAKHNSAPKRSARSNQPRRSTG